MIITFVFYKDEVVHGPTPNIDWTFPPRSVWDRYLVYNTEPLPTNTPKFSPWATFQERVDYMTVNSVNLRTEPGKSNMCFTQNDSKLLVRHLQCNPDIAQLVMESCLPWELDFHLILLMPRMQVRVFEHWPVHPYSICAVVDVKHFHKFINAGVELDTGFNMYHRRPRDVSYFLPTINYIHGYRDFFNFNEHNNDKQSIYD